MIQPPRTPFSAQFSGENVSSPNFFGEYRLLKELGKGAMGTVWKAEEVLSRRIVALKVLNANLTEEQQQIHTESFNKEARILGGLDHRNLIACHAFGEVDGQHYMAMEFVSGETLLSHLAARGGKLSEKYALSLIKEIVRGLGYSHAKGIVHCDVKPANILLGVDGSVKLSDFGVAKKIQKESLETTASLNTTVVGSPYFMPPEQVRADSRLDHRADFYAIGVTLYQLLTGEMPIKGSTGREIMMSHLSVQPIDIRQHNPNLSEGCSELVQCLMSKNPDHRYQKAIEIIEDIECILKGESPKHCHWVKNKAVAVPQKKSSKRIPRIAAVVPKNTKFPNASFKSPLKKWTGKVPRQFGKNPPPKR